MYTAKSGK